MLSVLCIKNLNSDIIVRWYDKMLFWEYWKVKSSLRYQIILSGSDPAGPKGQRRFAPKQKDLGQSFELDTNVNQSLLIYMSTDSVYLVLDILNVECVPDHPEIIIEETFVKLSHCFPWKTRGHFRFILLWSEIIVSPHSYLFTNKQPQLQDL